MKSFSVLSCGKFPKDPNNGQLQDVLRDSNLFVGRDLATKITVLSNRYHGFVLAEIEHSYVHPKPGRALALVGPEYKEVKFSDYVEDVTLKGYYREKEQVLILEAKKEIAQDVYKHIAESDGLKGQIEVQQKEIDLDELESRVDEFETVWFKDIRSGGLRSASMAGSSLREHAHFQEYKEAGGKLSYVTVPFVYDGRVQKIGLTTDSTVVLQQKYDNTRIELELVMEVTEKLLKPLWKNE